MPSPLLRNAALVALGIGCGACSRGADLQTSEDSSNASADPAGTPVSTNRVLWLTYLNVDAGEPAACFDEAGRLWVAWLQLNGERPSLKFACVGLGAADAELHDSPILARGTLAPTAPGLGRPCLMPASGGVVAAWETREEGRQRLQARTLEFTADRVELGPLEPIADGGLEPAGVGLDDGRVALVWQARAGDAYDVFTSVRDAGGWSEPLNASSTDLDEWAPALAAGPGGTFWITWDVFVDGSFDVVLHGPHGGPDLATGRRAFAGPRYSAFARPAVDDRGRVWVACETAPDFGHGGSLRAPRRTELVCFDGDQRFAARLPLPEDADHQLPRLAATPDGLVLATRTSAEPGGRPDEESRQALRPRTYSAWGTHLHGLGADSPESQELRRTIGGNEESGVLLPAPAGPPLLVFSADDRVRFFGSVTAWRMPIERPWRIGIVRTEVAPGWPELGPPISAEPAPGPDAARGNETPVDGWMFGDLHRHSHLSRCAGDQDGLRVDTYRFALGPGALDFVALADHFQHLTRWSWWRSLRDVERFDMAPRLVTLAGIERKITSHGHQNLIYQEPRDAEGDDLAWSLAHSSVTTVKPPRVTAIPHMTTSENNTFPLADLDLRLHRVVELYQGLRGSYEGTGLPHRAYDQVEGATGAADLLNPSHPVGWIGSTDHSESGDGVAVLRTSDRSRAGVLQALIARATLAATGRSAVELRVGDLLAGQVGQLAADSPVEVEIVRSTAPVAYIELVQSGQTVLRDAPPGDALLERVQLSMQRTDATPDNPIRVEVTGGRLASQRIRHGEREGVGLRQVSESQLEFWSGPNGTDVVLVLERASAEAELGLDVSFEDSSGSVPMSSIELGRAEPIKGLRRRRDFIWRLGPVAADSRPPGPERFTLQSPGWSEGDSIYARVVFEDGNVVWTSPIFATSITR